MEADDSEMEKKREENKGKFREQADKDKKKWRECNREKQTIVSVVEKKRRELRDIERTRR